MITVGGLRIVSIDTSIPQHVEGGLDPQQLEWLRGVLTAPAEHGTVLAMHHAPVPVEVTALQRLQSATRVFAAARDAAPHATLLIVGPLWHSGPPPADLLAERDTVRRAATIVKAPFVDPIKHHWLPAKRRDVLLPDHVHPTAAGQAVLAAKFEKLLRQTLR